MYIITSLKYHRITDKQSRVMTKVHDLLGQPSYSCNSIGVYCLNVHVYWLFAAFKAISIYINKN